MDSSSASRIRISVLRVKVSVYSESISLFCGESKSCRGNVAQNLPWPRYLGCRRLGMRMDMVITSQISVDSVEFLLHDLGRGTRGWSQYPEQEDYCAVQQLTVSTPASSSSSALLIQLVHRILFNPQLIPLKRAL
ncbi:hypothetical protein SAY87_021922 [Trapa incisa]|uniref:Uncharacterized protein n=1 Tax=Trapa incisa TaxID=236973 RepID=A0AAN7PSN2_9MYRT|nr:hypothetical protein SAY87_021922 [Trapa incisa]